jgi:hypothetical protein
MDNDFIQRILWQSRLIANAIGWPGGVAIGLVLICSGVGFAYIKPLQSHLMAIQQEANTLRIQSKRTRLSEQSSSNPAQQLASFYRFFPQQDSVAGSLGKLYGAASVQNLNLDLGEYHLVHERDSKLTRYEIVLPVKGGYVQIRKFIAQVLADIPNLALNGMTFTRQKIDDPLLEAQLQFTLYLGEQ